MTTTPYAKLTSVVTLSAILMLQFGSGTDCLLGQDAGQARLETVATFDGPMPTGVAVSKKGRIFVNFPRWGDGVSTFEHRVISAINNKAKQAGVVVGMPAKKAARLLLDPED